MSCESTYLRGTTSNLRVHFSNRPTEDIRGRIRSCRAEFLGEVVYAMENKFEEKVIDPLPP